MTEGGANPDSRRLRRRVGIAAIVVGLVASAAIGTFMVLLSQVSTRSVTVDEARQDAGASGLLFDGDTGAIPFRPEAGIYRYRGEGTERLDKPPTSQNQGPRVPGTLTHLEDGCWRLRVDYNINHWQSWDYCATDDGLTENAGEFFQRLDLVVTKVETSSSYTCDPPADAIRTTQQVGQEWIHECRGTSSGTDGQVVSAGPYTFEGPETLDIGGEQVEALHYRRLRNLSGAQTGTEDVQTWFHAKTGLPLVNQRDIEVRSDSLIGAVTYSEQGRFEVVSMTPSR